METYLKDLRWGRFNLIKGDMICNIASHYGEWSPVEVEIYNLLLSPTDNVVEVGANIGMHSVPLAQMVSQGKLICFEPQRIIFQQLNCNLALNNITNTETYRLGVGNQAEQIMIESCDYSNAWNYGAFSLEKGFSGEGTFQGHTQKERLDIVKLDEFLPVTELDSLALLKIDAEGFEVKVLEGARRIIQNHLPAIFVEALPNQWQPIWASLKEMDYQAFWVASRRYQPNNFYQSPEVEQGYDINFLAFPKAFLENFVSQSVSQSITRTGAADGLVTLIKQLVPAEVAFKENATIPFLQL